ncbi:hypothetical protein CN217_26505 [Sinorhizobium meliloti]|uniref:hypothetical protein n=1 Tax=Rhizobium meliloti TaxID=382 RepID=UPI000FD50430|nr:hypothetical protein [Sinorhizobium meliloti]RVH05056.1 hypothetical protein CN217_26505 [Sinorhizobium meliloti]
MSIRVWLGDGMAEPESDIELKIDFVEDEGSPARVFEIAAQIIRAFEDLDRALISSVDSTISTTMVLEDVEKSSLKVFLRNVLKQLDDQALKDLDWKPLVGQYLVKSKRVAIEWLDRKIDDDQPAGIEDLTERLQKLAAETDVRHIPDYPKLNPARIAQPLDELQRAKSKFLPDEGLVITLGKEDYRVDLSSTWMPSEHMSEVKGDKILSNTTDMVLVIKKPDLLGKSKWQFRHGKKNLSVPITDEQWLKEFHEGAHPLSPGDALSVRMRHVAVYSEKGDLKESSETIVKVMAVIKNAGPAPDLFEDR